MRMGRMDEFVASLILSGDVGALRDRITAALRDDLEAQQRALGRQRRSGFQVLQHDANGQPVWQDITALMVRTTITREAVYARDELGVLEVEL